MFQFLLVVHFIICILLIIVVLLQTGTGAQLGAAFGGSGNAGQQIRTPENLIGKLTTIFAVIFIISSVCLAIFSTDNTSVFDDSIPTETTPKE